MISKTRTEKAAISPIFYGWWIVAASFVSLGLAVGLPYFSLPFFYDYFARPVSEGGFGWSVPAITLGLPLGTLLTLWVGPLLMHRFPPRRLILIGTALTTLTFFGFGRMQGNLWLYWMLWVLYMTGNIFSGGLPHQLIIAEWFVRRRGLALSIAYLGISVVGAFSAQFIVKPLTAWYGFETALQLLGVAVLLGWPLILWVMRERPEEMNLRPDGEAMPPMANPMEAAPEEASPSIYRDRRFWILVLSGVCLSGATGAVSQHLKLILKENGFSEQSMLDLVFSQTLSLLLFISVAGRLLVGWLADRFPKRHVLTLTFLLFSASLPFLFLLQPGKVPYAFAILFGLSVGGDFLVILLMAGDHFRLGALARVLGLLLPALTMGQAWFPYFISLVREFTGSYAVPLGITFGVALLGRLAMALMPQSKN